MCLGSVSEQQKMNYFVLFSLCSWQQWKTILTLAAYWFGLRSDKWDRYSRHLMVSTVILHMTHDASSSSGGRWFLGMTLCLLACSGNQAVMDPTDWLTDWASSTQISQAITFVMIHSLNIHLYQPLCENIKNVAHSFMRLSPCRLGTDTVKSGRRNAYWRYILRVIDCASRALRVQFFDPNWRYRRPGGAANEPKRVSQEGWWIVLTRILK